MEVKVKVWLEDGNDNLIFGSGKTEILENIDETGSMSQTASKVGMNYKKVWSHIQILENHIEDKLVISKKGRGANSGSRLTPKAKELIELFNLLDEDVKKYTQKRFEELFSKEKIIKIKEQGDL